MTHTRHRAIRSTGQTRLLQSIAWPLLLLAAACSGGEPEADTIDQETFIQTYVDLRVAALQTDSQLLGDPDRVEILERNGVSAEELVRFAEVHGDDVDFMRNVWNEVEVRMDALRPEPEGR